MDELTRTCRLLRDFAYAILAGRRSRGVDFKGAGSIWLFADAQDPRGVALARAVGAFIEPGVCVLRCDPPELLAAAEQLGLVDVGRVVRRLVEVVAAGADAVLACGAGAVAGFERRGGRRLKRWGACGPETAAAA